MLRPEQLKKSNRETRRRRFFASSALLLTLSIFWLAAVAPKAFGGPDTLQLLGITGNESATRQFAEKNHLNQLDSATKKHSDGNTEVKLKSVKESPVVLLLPTQLTTDQAIEALIKIRSAKTMGATSVHIVSPGPIQNTRIVSSDGSPIPLALEPLLQEAGADSVLDGSLPRNLAPSAARHDTRRSRPTRNFFWNSEDSDLARNIQSQSGLQRLPDSTLESGESLAGSRVFLLNGRGETSNDRLFETLSSVQKMKSLGADVFLISPYALYARSDKPEPGDSTITTGRLAADLVEAAGTNEIAFVRLHAPQSSGFYKIPSHNLTSRPTLNTYLEKAGVISSSPLTTEQPRTPLFMRMSWAKEIPSF